MSLYSTIYFIVVNKCMQYAYLKIIKNKFISICLQSFYTISNINMRVNILILFINFIKIFNDKLMFLKCNHFCKLYNSFSINGIKLVHQRNKCINNKMSNFF